MSKYKQQLLLVVHSNHSKGSSVHNLKMPTNYEPDQQKLTEAANASFTLAFDQLQDKPCAELCSLQPNQYSGIYLKAAQNCYNHLKKLKANKPNLYYKGLVEAQKYQFNSISSTPSTIMTDNGNYSLSWGITPDTATSTPKKTKRVPVPDSAFSSLPSKNMLRTPTPTKKPMAGASPPPSGRGSGSQFKTLKDAINSCDDHFYVNFDYPEDNGHHFLCQRIDNAKTLDEKQHFSKVKLTYHGLSDLHDVLLHKGKMVLNGQAVIFWYPALPHYCVHEHVTRPSLPRNPRSALLLRTRPEKPW